jgi:hypothetical protein
VTLQPFVVADATLDWFRQYVRASFPLRDAELDKQRERLIDDGLLWAEPHIKLERAGLTGPRIDSLDGLVLQETLRVPWGFTELYDHQHRAIQRLAASRPDGPQNSLVLSGTGSGKTESFLIPVVDACLRDPGPGIKAVVIYPMNALANDQLKRLRELLTDIPQVTYGRYTGDTPETDAGDPRRPGRPEDAPSNLRWSRQAMRDQPPNILLTNYTMLEYLLVRRRDEELFQHGAPHYLIVDEIHLFTGVLGAEVGCLLRRFRQHVAGSDGRICAVGTSATAGNEQEAQGLLRFAQRFFGAPFGADAMITETQVPFADPGPNVPPVPTVTPQLLEAARDNAGLTALAKEAFGIDLPGDDTFPEALGRVIDQFATVGVVERALARPAPLKTAAEALGGLPERADVRPESLRREAEAVLLLGAAARLPTVGEAAPEPRFRPRLHQMIRSLAGLWRCVDPAHGLLAPPDGSRCSCGAFTLPLATCRTCGEAFWTSPAPTREVDSVRRVEAVDQERDAPSVFLADPVRLPQVIDEDEEGTKVRWMEATLCPDCGAFAPEGRNLEHLSSCLRPAFGGVRVLASTDQVHCPACGDLGAQNRPILLPLKGSAAASTAVLTQGLSDELRRRTDEAGGRLLVFADSRQNAAQQAGYADDQGARIAVRQLVVEAVRANGPTTLQSISGAVYPLVLDDPASRRRWLVGEATRNFPEVSDPDYEMSVEDRNRIERQLSWEVALEVTERARRRFSLEQEGVIVVGIDDLEVLAAKVATTWPSHSFSELLLLDVIHAVIDAMRYGRAVSHWMLKLDPRSLVQNHGVRIGDRAVNATRGYGKKKFTSRKDGLDIRPWTAPQHATRMTELVGRILKKAPTEVNDTVETLAARLISVGLLTESQVAGRKRSMVDQGRLLCARRYCTTSAVGLCAPTGTVPAPHSGSSLQSSVTSTVVSTSAGLGDFWYGSTLGRSRVTQGSHSRRGSTTVSIRLSMRWRAPRPSRSA